MQPVWQCWNVGADIAPGRLEFGKVLVSGHAVPNSHVGRGHQALRRKAGLEMIRADQRHGDLTFARMRPAGQHVIKIGRADKVLVIAHLAHETAGAVVEA